MGEIATRRVDGCANGKGGILHSSKHGQGATVRGICSEHPAHKTGHTVNRIGEACRLEKRLLTFKDKEHIVQG